MDLQKIYAAMDARKNELFETLCELIRVPSQNFTTHGDEEAMAGEMDKRYRALGLESELYSPMDLPDFDKHPDYVDGHHLENRPNVTARWKGLENTDDVMLMGHSDTVEVGNLANWDFDPFEGFVRDGKICGRGACDDKYALATQLFVVKILQDAGFVPKKNVLLCAYCDEEHGGSHGALAAVLKHPCSRIVNMDGRFGQIWHCGSGGGEMEYRFATENTADSAKCAADALPVILEVIDKFAENRKEELANNRFYAGTIIPETSLRYLNVRAGYDGTDLGRGEVAFVFYTDKSKAEIDTEFAAFAEELREKLAPMGIIGEGFFPRTRFFHYVFCEPDSKDIEAMRTATVTAGDEAPIVCGSCLSDYSVISKYGTSNSYAYGAGRDFSKPGGAHQPNEYMECDTILQYAKNIATYLVQTLS